MFVEAFCFVRLNLRRFFGKVGFWGVFCSRVFGKKLIFLGVWGYRKSFEDKLRLEKNFW